MKRLLFVMLLFPALVCHLYSQELSIQWKTKTNASIFASPVEEKGIIYIGSLDSVFRAIDIKNGREVWQFKAEHEIRSTACFYKKLVFFESGNVLYAFNKNGKLKWKQELCSDSIKNQLDPWDFYHASPVVHDDKVFIATQKGWLIAFNARNGQEIFRYQTPSKLLIRTTPAISDKVAYFGDWDGVVYAYNFTDKKLDWSYDTRQDTTYMWVNAVQTQLTLTEDKLYFGGRNSRLYALDRRTGKKVWMYASPTNQWILGKPLVHQGKVFVGSSDQHLLLSFDKDTGKPRWETKMDSRTWGNITAKGEKLYIGSRAFYVVNAEDGNIKQKLDFPAFHKDVNYGKYVDRRANFHSSPLVVGNKIVVGSDDGHLYCFSIDGIEQ